MVAGRPGGAGEPLNQPLVLASNVRGGGEYSRTHGTATWAALEEAVGALEGGRALSFATGMAAAAAVIYALAPKVIVLPTYSYLGVRSLLAEHAAQGTLELRPVDITDTAAVLAAAEGADIVWVETPTNPTLDVADLAGIGAALQPTGVQMVVDSTFATPLRQQPLTHGATVVIHSGTKFIGGHSDLMIGLCVTADDAVHERLVAARTFQGATPGALEAFLALRGLRTLPVRLAASERNAAELVARLRAHPARRGRRLSRHRRDGVVRLRCGRAGGRRGVRQGAGDRAGDEPGRGRDDDRAPPEVRRRRPRAAGAAADERRHRGRRRPLGRPRSSAVSRLKAASVRIGRSRYVSSGAWNPKRSYNPWASRVCNIQRRWAPGPSSIIAFTSATPSPAPRTVGRMKTSAR